MLSTRSKTITLQLIQDSLAKAKKEGSLSSDAVVEGVFARRGAKERRRLNISLEDECKRVVTDVGACGEFDRIMGGCHTHFVSQQYTETYLEKTCEAYEWLWFYDRLQTAVYGDQLGECVAYMPFCAQGFHELFAQEKSESQRSLERKRDSWEAFEKEKQNREIIDSWMGSLDGRMKQVFNRNVFAEEFVSLILRVISPDLRPV
jgi:chromosome transmission fidelity protein 18